MDGQNRRHKLSAPIQPAHHGGSDQERELDALPFGREEKCKTERSLCPQQLWTAARLGVSGFVSKAWEWFSVALGSTLWARGSALWLILFSWKKAYVCNWVVFWDCVLPAELGCFPSVSFHFILSLHQRGHRTLAFVSVLSQASCQVSVPLRTQQKIRKVFKNSPFKNVVVYVVYLGWEDMYFN